MVDGRVCGKDAAVFRHYEAGEPGSATESAEGKSINVRRKKMRTE